MVAHSDEHARVSESESVLAIAKRRRRFALVSAAALVVLYLGYIALTTSTTVLSGSWAGLGTAYWLGFAIFGLLLAVAHGYARWAKRTDALRAMITERGEHR